MPQPIAIPDSVESISAEWLSQAVSQRYPGSKADSFKILDAHSGTTGRVQLVADWQAGSDAPSALFGKLAPTDPISRQMVAFTDMGRREARFYDSIASEVCVRIPSPIWSAWSDADPSRYFMILEDLSSAGCSFPSHGDGGPQTTPEAMIDTLAKLHGQFWESSRFEDDLSWIDAPMRSSIGPQLVEEGLRQFGERMPAPFHDLAELYLQHNEAVCDLLDSGPSTLTHGDSHIGNTFLDGDEIGLLDWACVCRAPGMRDVSYYLCNSVPSATRASTESALVSRYLKRLEDGGGKAAPFDEAWRQYRRLATCSWIAATATAAAGSRMQTLEVGLRAMDRATKAIVDLDTPALLREELGL